MTLKRIAKIGLLLTIKESYLFCRNSLGLVWHPFKTLVVMFRQKDRSQQLLILSWPVYVLVFGTAITWLGRRLIATTVEWGVGAKSVFGLTLLGFIVMGVYLGYWGYRVWRSR
jgi:hypothetical protein